MMKFAPETMAAVALCAAMSFPGFSQAATPAVGSGHHAQIAHGEYLVKDVAGCGDCHTPMNDKGQPMPGQWLQGAKLTFQPLVPFPAGRTPLPELPD